MQARPATLWAATLDPGDHALLDPGVPAGLDRRPDVLVGGGGVIGLGTAVSCQRAGRGPSLGGGAAGRAGCTAACCARRAVWRRAAPAARGAPWSPSCTAWRTRPRSWPWRVPAWI